MRLEFLAEVEKGKNPEKVSKTLGFKLYQSGMIAMQSTLMTAKGAAAGLGAGIGGTTPGPLKLIVGGIIYTAKTGADYRAYKKGRISKSEFKRRMKVGAAATAGSITGSSVGMVGGFVAGQVIIPLPLIGGIIGCVAGGFVGGIMGTKTAVRIYERFERK